MSNPHSLRSLILKAKYERNKRWEHVTNSKNLSYHWRNIMKGIESIKNDICWFVGDGNPSELELIHGFLLHPLEFQELTQDFVLD